MKETTILTACPYCGQVVAIEIPDNENYSEADLKRAATLNCSCPEGRYQRAIREQIRDAKNNLTALSSEDAQNMGFQPIGDENVIEAMEKLIELAGYGKVLDVTIKLSGLAL